LRRGGREEGGGYFLVEIEHLIWGGGRTDFLEEEKEGDSFLFGLIRGD